MAQFLPQFARETMLSNTSMEMDSMSTDTAMKAEDLKKLADDLESAGKTDADNFIRYLQQNRSRKYVAWAMLQQKIPPSDVYDHFVTTTEHNHKAVEPYMTDKPYPEQVARPAPSEREKAEKAERKAAKKARRNARKQADGAHGASLVQLVVPKSVVFKVVMGEDGKHAHTHAHRQAHTHTHPHTQTPHNPKPNA